MKLKFYPKGWLMLLNESGSTLRSMRAFSDVRNELNGERPDVSVLPDVVYSVNKDRTRGKPVMPRPFPKGEWQVIGYETDDSKWLKPAKILTNAHQLLDVWSLKDDGTYDKPTGEKIDDYGYWIHYANGSHHTDGCIGLLSRDDLLYLKERLVYPLDIEVAE